MGVAVRMGAARQSSDDCICVGEWFLLTFRIGEPTVSQAMRTGSIHARLMLQPPTDPTWADNVTSHTHLFPPDVEVIEHAWPVRTNASKDEVTDPLTGTAQSGPLFRYCAACGTHRKQGTSCRC